MAKTLHITEDDEEVTLAGPPANGRALIQHQDGRLEPVPTDQLVVRDKG